MPSPNIHITDLGRERLKGLIRRPFKMERVLYRLRDVKELPLYKAGKGICWAKNQFSITIHELLEQGLISY